MNAKNLINEALEQLTNLRIELIKKNEESLEEKSTEIEMTLCKTHDMLSHQSTLLPLSDKEIEKGVEKIFFKKVGAMWMNLARSEMIDLMIKSAKWTRDQHTPNTAESERIKELETLINSPEINDFLEGVKLESAHQTERHNRKLEENKYPHDYALVLDKLKGKQALSIWDKNTEKYKHHLITMAAVCFNVHRQVDKKLTAINEWFNPSPPNK